VDAATRVCESPLGSRAHRETGVPLNAFRAEPAQPTVALTEAAANPITNRDRKRRLPLPALRGSTAKPGPPSCPRRRRSGLFRQPLPAVAVTAQFVHFLPKLIPTGFHLGEKLAQSHHLGFQHRELEGQSVSVLPDRLRRGAPIVWNVARTGPDRRGSWCEPRRSSLSQAVRHVGLIPAGMPIGRLKFLELRYPASASAAMPTSVIARVDASGVAPADALAAKSAEREDPSNR